jgi:hypothetical protein
MTCQSSGGIAKLDRLARHGEPDVKHASLQWVLLLVSDLMADNRDQAGKRHRGFKSSFVGLSEGGFALRQVRKWLPKPLGRVKGVMVQRPPELQLTSA